MGKTARNEQRKLGATLLNAVAASILGATAVSIGAHLTPGWIIFTIGIAAVVGLHLLARAVLRGLEE